MTHPLAALLGRPTRAQRRVKHWEVHTYNPATLARGVTYQSASKREAQTDAARYIRPDCATSEPRPVYYR